GWIRAAVSSSPAKPSSCRSFLHGCCQLVTNFTFGAASPTSTTAAAAQVPANRCIYLHLGHLLRASIHDTLPSSTTATFSSTGPAVAILIRRHEENLASGADRALAELAARRAILEHRRRHRTVHLRRFLPPHRPLPDRDRLRRRAHHPLRRNARRSDG